MDSKPEWRLRRANRRTGEGPLIFRKASGSREYFKQISTSFLSLIEDATAQITDAPWPGTAGATTASKMAVGISGSVAERN